MTEGEVNEAFEVMWEKQSAAIRASLIDEKLAKGKIFCYYYVIVVEFHSYTVNEDLQEFKKDVSTGIYLYKVQTNLTNLNVLTRLYKFVKLLKYHLTLYYTDLQDVKKDLSTG